MDWNDLRYFLAVHEAGSLAGAARALRVDHATVGRRLDALERDLGAKLFTRSPEGLTFTVAGAALLPEAREMARVAEAALRRVQGEDARIEGTVRLTTSEGFAGYLAQRLGPLREQYPALLVEILGTNRQLDLLRGEADVALRLAPPTQPDLIARRVAETGWALYASQGYIARRGAPATPEALGGHDVIGFDASFARIPGAVWLGDGRGGTFAMRVSGLLPALNATIAGVGIAVLPCLLGDAEPTLTRLSAGVLVSCEAYLVLHRDLARVGRVRAVLDYLSELMAREASRLSGVASAT